VYEIDFLPVGDGERSGDAIAMRFTRPDNGQLAVVTVDAGFEKTGIALADFVNARYGTSTVDLAILTHPDGDHIGGMGQLLQRCVVKQLWLHDLGGRGGANLDAAKAVDSLIARADAENTSVYDVFTGATFAGALTVLGPDQDYYAGLVADQVAEEASASVKKAGWALHAASRRLGNRLLQSLPFMPPEIPFDDKGGTSPRNNTSMITLWDFDGTRALLCGDAGVQALERAWNWLEQSGLDTSPPEFVQVAHHGSRHNSSSRWLDRLLTAESGTAYVSVSASNPDHPSARVLNAYARRGYAWQQTAGQAIWKHSSDAPDRADYFPLESKGPLDESGED
jgi:hypothetical protein